MFVATIVQQVDGSRVVHIIREIEITTYNHGKLGKSQESKPITGGKCMVSQLYDFVKEIPRDDGGLKVTPKQAREYPHDVDIILLL